jgi:hypothetical protein
MTTDFTVFVAWLIAVRAPVETHAGDQHQGSHGTPTTTVLYTWESASNCSASFCSSGPALPGLPVS